MRRLQAAKSQIVIHGASPVVTWTFGDRPGVMRTSRPVFLRSTLLRSAFLRSFVLLLPLFLALLVPDAVVKAEEPRELQDVGHPTFVSPQFAPIVIAGELAYVANTPADSVDLIDLAAAKVIRRIPVGIDPVSLAIRPDGKELWVANHISDSVSVIDLDPQSPSFQHVIATIQDLDPRTRATRFDEPVGIAFANNDKAYVALSSENQIAVIDVAGRRVKQKLSIAAQDPRAILVRGDRLYVIPFESNNQTQLSGGVGELDGDLETFDAYQHSIAVNNVLSLGHVVDVVKHPRVPDRDLFVFDTETDRLIETVTGLGTLLYGMTVDSQGRVFIAQTDARNDINGRSGTAKHGLGELANRAFLNQVTRIQFDSDGSAEASRIELEPLPPSHPGEGEAMATPFGIVVNEDDSILFVTAAGSDRLASINVETGEVLGRIQVGAVPRGIALGTVGGEPIAAVLNAVDNSVSVINVKQPTEMRSLATIDLEDPTHPEVKRGRIAFNSAKASTTRTFSCASCHPDGHTDQLLWVLDTPIVTGGEQIMPRSTMPLRGLQGTEPFHWDGVPGDPYGGNNSGNIRGSDPPNSDAADPRSSVRHLIDGGLATTMKQVDDLAVNDEEKKGYLSSSERDDLAAFLLSVPFPPAQRRPYDDQVSERARRGFELFHIEGDLDGKPQPNVCGNCHRLPFLVSTNTPGTGMDAPTWRGAYDRFLILPQGRLNIIDFDFYERVANAGFDERSIWQFSWAGRRRFDPVWDMVLEASTGYSGALGRQLTLDSKTVEDDEMLGMLAALEQAAGDQAIILACDGVFTDRSEPQSVSFQFVVDPEGLGQGSYIQKLDLEESEGRVSMKSAELLEAVRTGAFIGTFTARHGAAATIESPQPALWTLGPIEQQRGRQEFPMLWPKKQTMVLSSRYVTERDQLFVNGVRVSGAIVIEAEGRTTITLDELPPNGLNLLQVQTPFGRLSNEFIFYAVDSSDAAEELKRQQDAPFVDRSAAIRDAIRSGNLKRTMRLVSRLKSPDEQVGTDGVTALNLAAMYGKSEIAKALIEDAGAKVSATNGDGNSALHLAAFFAHPEMVEYLLKQEADVDLTNERGETPAESVAAEWSDELAGFYQFVAGLIGQDLDLERIKKQRPLIAKRLRDAALNQDE